MRRQLYFAGAFLFAGFEAFAAEPVISADRADCLYAAGERVVFTVRGDASLGSVDIWIDDGGTTVVARAVCDFAATNVCELSAMRDTPGALRLRVAGPKCKKCLYGVLCDWEGIRPAAPCPSDFDAYWRGERERLAATVPLDPKMERVPARDTPERLFYRLSFATFGGKRVHGAMTVPKAGKEAGLQLNFYYSLMDWHRKDYPVGDVARDVLGDQRGDYASYKRFMLAQITELIDSYHPGNIWFDGEWEHARNRGGKCSKEGSSQAILHGQVSFAARLPRRGRKCSGE